MRGSYCTPKYVADALPPFDLDPFSNARSHIRAAVSLALARGEDGFGDKTPGSFRSGTTRLPPLTEFAVRGLVIVQLDDVTDLLRAGASGLLRATSRTRAWLQPDYTETMFALRHYMHTRWVALLKYDPRPEWADLVGEAAGWIGVLSNSPGHSSFEFDRPPGIGGAGNSWPHALYARRYEDVTPEMRALCSFPNGSARHHRKRSALDGDPTAVRVWLQRWGFDAAHFDLTTSATT